MRGRRVELTRLGVHRSGCSLGVGRTANAAPLGGPLWQPVAEPGDPLLCVNRLLAAAIRCNHEPTLACHPHPRTCVLAGPAGLPHRLPPHCGLDPAHRIPGGGEHCECGGWMDGWLEHLLRTGECVAVASSCAPHTCLCWQAWTLLPCPLPCPTPSLPLPPPQMPTVNSNANVNADAQSAAAFFSGVCAPADTGALTSGGKWDGVCSACRVGRAGAEDRGHTLAGWVAGRCRPCPARRTAAVGSWH